MPITIGLFLFRLLSRIPFPVIYFFSDAAAFFLGNVLRYRREIILDNLQNAFPEKKNSEIKRLAVAYYRNLCDVFVEAMKLLTITEKELLRRVEFNDLDLADEVKENQSGGIVCFGHQGNWEWLGATLCLFLHVETAGVYQPLKSKFFDRLMLEIRSRTGNRMIPVANAFRDCILYLKNPTYYGFLFDQNPAPGEVRNFFSFFGRQVPFPTGMAKISLKTAAPFYFAQIQRTKRGHYQMSWEKIPLEGHDEISLTALAVKKLEAAIRENPSSWLWSHRRWKYKPVQNHS